MLSSNTTLTDPTALEILKGASELFMRYGVKSITMDEIARHLSVSKKTIYQHFSDKDHLVITFTNVVLNQQRSDMEALTSSCPNVMEGMMKLSDYMRTHVCNINPGLLFDLKKYFPQAWKIFVEHKREFFKNHLISILKKGIIEGYFRSNINLEILARMRLEQVEMAFNPDIFPPAEFVISDVHIQLFNHFVYGICTLKGHEEIDRLTKA